MSVRRLAEVFNQEAGDAGNCTQAFLDVVGGTSQVISLRVNIDGVLHMLQTPVHAMSDDGYEEVRKLARALVAVKQPPGATGGLEGVAPGSVTAPPVAEQHVQQTSGAVQTKLKDEPFTLQTPMTNFNRISAAPVPEVVVHTPPAPVAVSPPVPPAAAVAGELTETQTPNAGPSAPTTTTSAEGRSGRKVPTADQLPNPFFD